MNGVSTILFCRDGSSSPSVRPTLQISGGQKSGPEEVNHCSRPLNFDVRRLRVLHGILSMIPRAISSDAWSRSSHWVSGTPSRGKPCRSPKGVTVQSQARRSTGITRAVPSLCLLKCCFAAFIEYVCRKKVLFCPGNSRVRQLGGHEKL